MSKDKIETSEFKVNVLPPSLHIKLEEHSIKENPIPFTFANIISEKRKTTRLSNISIPISPRKTRRDVISFTMKPSVDLKPRRTMQRASIRGELGLSMSKEDEVEVSKIEVN